MIKKQLILLAKKNQDWIDIVKSFGVDEPTAQDIVQEMFIKIQLKLEKDKLNIMYNENELNYYYIFITLKSLFIDYTRKKKNIYKIPIDNVHLTNTDINYDNYYEKVEAELEKMYWYDRKVFEIINNGESIAEFARKSYIPYYSLYNTYHKVKNKLKKLL
jgi:DNA-directed RNA polymerase specialized sigma24 family protein